MKGPPIYPFSHRARKRNVFGMKARVKGQPARRPPASRRGACAPGKKVKGRFTGAHPIRSGLQTALIGGVAAGAAFLIARLIMR
jgi:hypothetical protein